MRSAQAVAKRALRGRFDASRYGDSYFGAGRQEGDRVAGISGYDTYERASSNSDFSAFLIWRHFDVQRTLEVGAAMGYLVESLRELDIEAYGLDISRYAVENGAPAARPYLQVGNLLKKLPVGDGEHELVIALETLEHLPPKVIPKALRELRRACGGWLLATIPSFGPNEHGPDGFFSGKVRPERLEHYDSLPSSWEGPVPYDDLMRDASGEPIEGHLTIASFSWWTKRFEEAGFERCGEMERRLHVDIEDLGFKNLWDTYVFRVPGTPLPPEHLRPVDEVEALRARWDLEARRPQPR